MTQAADVDVARGTDGDAPDRPALRRVTSLDPDRFAAEVWGRTASLSRREDLPAGFGDLFGLDSVDDLVGRHGLRTPFLRVAKDGQTLPASRFTRGGGVGATIADQVADDALVRLFADGCTIVLQGLHRIHGPVVDLAQALMADLGHPVQVNAYVTPPASQGFSAHYDVHDVFVLQVAGEKHWTIHEPVREAPLRDEPWGERARAVAGRAAQDPLLDVTLRPGDALYLPRGFLHAATALGETSAHLTIGVHPWTRHHLVEQVLAGVARDDAGRDDAALRASLPLGVDVTDPAALAADLEATIDALTRALRDVRAADVAQRLARADAGARRAAPVGPMAQARAIDAVDLWTRLRARPYLRVRLTTEPDGGGQVLVARTAETTLRLPHAVRAAVERLVAGEVVAVAELGDLADADDADGGTLTDAERLDVARALLRDAVAVPA